MLDRFATARGLGFEAVECQLPYDHPAEELARACGDEKLRFVMFYPPPGDMEAGEYGISDLSGREAEFTSLRAMLFIPHCIRNKISRADRRRPGGTFP